MLTPYNLARVAKLLALLLFLLPWVTVSCAEQPLISMSGLDLVTGNVTMTNPVTHVTEAAPGGGKGDVLIMIGAILILLSLAATFVLNRRNGAMAAIAGCALAAAALAYTVLVRIPKSAHEGALGSGGGATQGVNQAQIAEMIRVNVEIGFWLVLAVLAAAIALNFMAMKDAPAAAAAAPPAPPPAEPPTG